MKKRSLSQKLFRTYTGWFTVYLLVLIGISVGYMAFIVKKDVRDTQEQLMQSMNENVQNYFETMNAFSLELMNSGEFKQISMNQLPEEFDKGNRSSELFSELYKEAYKMLPLKYNIGVVVNGDYYIWMGHHYYINHITEDISTYDTLVRDERPVVQYLEHNEYLEHTSPKQEEEQPYIAMSRSMDYRNRYLNGKAILEICVEQDIFETEMAKLSLKDKNSGLQMNIYDTKGNAIYKESDMDLSEYVNPKGTMQYERDGDFIAASKIFSGNVTMIYTRDQTAYLRKMRDFWGMALGLSAVVIGVIFLITYRLSKDISRPLYVMCENVQKIDLQSGIGFEEVATDINELDVLSDSLKQMSIQIKESLNQIIMLKDYEIHAKMLALQAQMQPHFLFNTLSMIAGMAEEEGNESIYRICMNLNSMFRYIVSKDTDGVHIFEELKHIESYVEIMKERFPESQVYIDIPLEMMSCRIPKLSIQPLVENAFKYCDRSRPEIYVTGRIDGDGVWTVEVKDNGAGFTAEKREEILEKCRESLKSEKTLLNQIDGMGLVNVFVRMNLFYGENMIYDIRANTSCIVIGGKRDGEKRTS